MRRNELDTLMEQLEEEANRRGIPVFRAQPIWDDEKLTTVHWQGRDGDGGWRAFFKVVEARKVPMVLLIAHSFHEAAFEPTPPNYRMYLDPETRAELEEQEQMLIAARDFAGQTGRVEIGWIEGDVYYQWGQETDWYSRVWELVMTRPFDGVDEDDED
jgi:hypothetical protein